MSTEDENHKRVYAYGARKAEGNHTQRNPFGGRKDAGLQDMCPTGVLVPPGFIITTEFCTYYYDYY
jgi:pyruvate,orthophosphate dikinase